jgi:hypothetical protein
MLLFYWHGACDVVHDPWRPGQSHALLLQKRGWTLHTLWAYVPDQNRAGIHGKTAQTGSRAIGF